MKDIIAGILVLALLAYGVYSLVTADCLYPAGNSHCSSNRGGAHE